MKPGVVPEGPLGSGSESESLEARYEMLLSESESVELRISAPDCAAFRRRLATLWLLALDLVVMPTDVKRTALAIWHVGGMRPRYRM